MRIVHDRRPIRLLHTSDIHLAPHRRQAPGDHLEQCLCVLGALRELVETHAVDAMLIAGDLFDHSRMPEEFVSTVFGALDSFGVDVIVLVGNHDVHDATSVYARYDHVVGESGVHLLLDHGGSQLDLLDGALRIWGKAMDEHRPEYQPLHGAADHPGDRWYVVMGHGLHGDERMTFGRSSVIRDEHIVATGADYVALGHIHVTQQVTLHPVPAWYPGSPSEARNPKALIVDLEPATGARVAPVDIEHPLHGCATLARA